uniref:Focal adhesion kinase N-terminal domain-containing protein n=2 Tax=Oryzias latipes TaxID=8090 RepID=H2MY81_ORYLA
MATAYLDPHLNNILLGGAKSLLSTGGADRTMAGSMDRVLKVFHYFETNIEHNFWSSNIRYGDATDVRVRRPKCIWPLCPMLHHD